MDDIFYLPFRHTYNTIVNKLTTHPDNISSNRKGETLYELHNAQLKVQNAVDTFFWQRVPSLQYLEREMAFYLSGSRKLEDAMKCSKFWEKCSDDGLTINSNYGAMLFYDTNKEGKTQFQYALEALKNNLHSKKAVMVLYGPDHAYISNDNPCTMFIHFHVVSNSAGDDVTATPLHFLNMRVIMRSNDIWFGTTYDVPFFFVVWEVMRRRLSEELGVDIRRGTYTHQALNLHIYKRDVKKWNPLLKEPELEVLNQFIDIINTNVEKFYRLSKFDRAHVKKYMDIAWHCSEQSHCLKKKCGCVIVHDTLGVVGTGYGGRNNVDCKVCGRDQGEVFHGDGCWSVHAEMRAVFEATRVAHTNFGTASESEQVFFSHCTVYVTHGPCDACLKLLDFVGVRNVVYDKPYKTDYSHWPNITVTQLTTD